MNDVRQNQKWEIQYGGLQAGSTNISTCRQHRNLISTVIPMFSGPSNRMKMVVMPINQTGRENIKMTASKLQLWPPFRISHFRFGRKLFQLIPLDSWTPKTKALPLWFAEISVCHFKFWFGSHHLDFLLPVRSDSIPNGSVGYIFPKTFPTV